MRDVAFDGLLQALREGLRGGETCLWVADEQAREVIPSVAAHPGLTVISNRFDVVQVARTTGANALFSDFDFSAIEPHSIDHFFYRVSKEKAVVQHVLDAAHRVLRPNGTCWFSGLKNEGTKTYYDKAKTAYADSHWEKQGAAYLARCTQPQPNPVPLDNQQYTEWRQLMAGELAVCSKPGIFGWNKIDAGSRFLVTWLPELLALFPVAPTSLLDMGCGYGYFIAATRDWPLQRRAATDNNAAAVAATQATAALLGMSVEVSADDFGAQLKGPFDVILCNPPFHQGFHTNDRLTEACLNQTRRLLAKNGAALFVVNGFISLESAAHSTFRSVEVVAHNGSFKLVLLRQPTPR